VTSGPVSAIRIATGLGAQDLSSSRAQVSIGSAQPRPPPTAADAAAGLGDAAADAPARGAGRPAVGPGRGFHDDHHDRLHGPALGRGGRPGARLARPTEIYVEWQLFELNGKFYRLPPKDDSYRSPPWDPGVPVDLPPFLAGLIGRQLRENPHQRCPCAAEHEGSGRYVFPGPDGGHYRRSNYGRRVFRPACDGRYLPELKRPGRIVIADATSWPGLPIAAWPPAPPPSQGTGSSTASTGDAAYAPPRGRGIQVIPDAVPLACWLPIKPGLTTHGLRHSHKTWMAEENIPEILAEQRLGHQVPGIRGLYAHASDRMRDDLKAALQARWQESLRDRAALNPHSPVPLLDELLAPIRAQDHQAPHPASLRVITQEPTTPPITPKMISQIPPSHPARASQRGRNGRLRPRR
jgi:hypothetical protein